MRTFFEQCVAKAAACFIYLVIVFPTIISADVYINNFAVHIEGGHEVASRVARDLGMRNLGQIGSLDDHYLFESPHRERRSADPSHEHHQLLERHGEVRWFEQQVAKSRKKRDFQPREVAEQMSVIDPRWADQWYLHGGGAGGFDMNVMGAWKKGYTGKNIVVTILDDGLERDHPDLKRNYDPYASYDINSHDTDPMPRYDYSNENRHGTRCAGEVSAEANNTYCTVGVAPDARIGGVRMLDGEVFDAVEAASLSFNRTHIDIYSASWGPDDDGKVVDGPGKMAKKAFIDGIHVGRGGKGSIFVWASGNGGSASDSCNCDGYANSIFTLSISSTSENGRKPWYLEECSSTLATTYSSGAYSEKRIATTDLRKTCTQGHTGTSASAPLAAGIVAMLLQANNNLTWRDVQYITLMTSRPDPMVDGQWITNGVGRKVSLRYGYGLLDASAMVNLGLMWNNVPPKQECLVLSSVRQQSFSSTEGFHGTLDSNGCKGLRTEVNYLEHVQCRLSLTAHRRGDLVIYLTSPQGTRSKILSNRPNDALQGGFDDWPFLSVHFWGENPTGTWKLEVQNGGFKRNNGDGVLLSWSLVLHGTKEQPIHLKNETYVKTTRQTPATSSSTTRTSTVHLSTAAPEQTTDGSSSSSAAPNTTTLPSPSTTPLMLQPSTKSFSVAPTDLSTDSTTESLWETSPDSPQSSAPSLQPSTESLPVAPTEPSTNSTTESLVETSPDSPQSSVPSVPSLCHQECFGGCHGTSSSDCVKCKHFRMDTNKECVLSCPDGFFASPDSSCKSCDISCATCRGPSMADCSSCHPGLFYDKTLNVCFAECKSGYYKHGKACLKCHSSCQDCTGSSTACTACQHGRQLTGQLCVSSSAAGNRGTGVLARNIGLLVVSLSLGFAVILVVVLGLVFARSREYLCWSEGTRYGRVPDEDKDAVVHLTYSDDLDDEYGR